MAAPATDSHEELTKWAAAREAQFKKWEADLKARQHALDLQEARIAKSNVCTKCQGVLVADSPLMAASSARIAMPSKSPPLVPISPRPPGFPAGSSMRLPRPALSPTPVLPPGRTVPMGASASLRLPLPVRPQIPSSSSVIVAKLQQEAPEQKKPTTADGTLGSFPGCLLEGFMIKKGAKVKNWKRRYFVLQVSGKLMYFENSDGRKYLGQLQVTSESSVGVRGNGGEGEEGGFWVCPEPNGRIYEFETGESELRDKWIEALNSLIGPLNMPRQWKQPKPEKQASPAPSSPQPPKDPRPNKVKIVVQIPGSFFKDEEEQAMEVGFYPTETVADVIGRAIKLAALIPGIQKEKLSQPLNLATAQGEVLEHAQVLQGTSNVVHMQ